MDPAPRVMGDPGGGSNAAGVKDIHRAIWGAGAPLPCELPDGDAGSGREEVEEAPWGVNLKDESQVAPSALPTGILRRLVLEHATERAAAAGKTPGDPISTKKSAMSLA